MQILKTTFLVSLLSLNLAGCVAGADSEPSPGQLNNSGEGVRFLGATSSGSLCSKIVANHMPLVPAPLSVIVDRNSLVDAQGAECTFSLSFEIPAGYEMPAMAWDIKGAARTNNDVAVPYALSITTSENTADNSDTQRVTGDLTSSWNASVPAPAFSASNCDGSGPKTMRWTVQLSLDDLETGNRIAIDSFDTGTTMPKKCGS
jgi:hypothetical protein